MSFAGHPNAQAYVEVARWHRFQRVTDISGRLDLAETTLWWALVLA